MKPSLTIVGLILATAPLAAFVMRPAVPQIPQHATITFHVTPTTPGAGGSGLLDQTTQVVLAVSKSGKNALVAGQPGAGQVDGVHSFANGSSALTIAQDHAGLLTGGGWVAGVDFLRTDNSIHLYGIADITLDCDHQQLYAGVSVDGR